MIKNKNKTTLNKVGREGNWIKGIYEKLTANIILSDERLNGFPLNNWNNLECLLLPDKKHLHWKGRGKTTSIHKWHSLIHRKPKRTHINT